ncbi:Maf-like protein YhdE [Candidatus Hepatincola sp. Av]
MLQNKQLVLASSSPQRLQILKNIGIIPNYVVNPDIDETPKKNERPYEFVKRIALAKAMAVKGFDTCFVLAADTVIVKGLQIIGKPKNSADALHIIKKLSGAQHKVLTGFTLKIPQYKNTQAKIITKVIKTDVKVKRLSETDLQNYIDSNKWQGYAGGYSIQGCFEVFIKSINGSLTNVIGLPSQAVYHSLVGNGYISSMDFFEAS